VAFTNSRYCSFVTSYLSIQKLFKYTRWIGDSSPGKSSLSPSSLAFDPMTKSPAGTLTIGTSIPPGVRVTISSTSTGIRVTFDAPFSSGPPWFWAWTLAKRGPEIVFRTSPSRAVGRRGLCGATFPKESLKTKRSPRSTLPSRFRSYCPP